MDEVYKKIIKPFKNEKIYVCGDSYSKRQAWMEGALETCNLVIRNISCYYGNYFFGNIRLHL